MVTMTAHCRLAMNRQLPNSRTFPGTGRLVDGFVLFDYDNKKLIPTPFILTIVLLTKLGVKHLDGWVMYNSFSDSNFEAWQWHLEEDFHLIYWIPKHQILSVMKWEKIVWTFSAWIFFWALFDFCCHFAKGKKYHTPTVTSYDLTCQQFKIGTMTSFDAL